MKLDTSKDAYESVKPDIKRIQQDVLAMIVSAPNGLTQNELEEEGASIGYLATTSTLRTRRSELEAKGLVYRTDEKRPSNSGRPSYVFKATINGVLAVSPDSAEHETADGATGGCPKL